MAEKVFITGVEGFCGAHLAKKLIEKGYDVIGLSYNRKPASTLTMLGLDDKITKIYGDVRDRNLMKRILTNYYIKHVYHLAAQAIVGVALRNPLDTFEVNCMGTTSILDACRDLGTVKSILVASTDKVYGEGLSKKEEDKLNGQGIYETSKVCMDYIANAFQKVYKLPVVVTRACNIYGEHDLNRRIVPNTIRDLKAGKQPIIFKGEKSIREYVHVDDVCDAYIFLSENIDKTQGLAFNVGSGFSIGQEEMVMKLIEISGLKITPIHKEKSKSLFEIYQQTINTERIKALGWKPKYTLDDGLRRTWEKWQ